MEHKTTKKDIILDAALTLFAEKGFDGVGVDEIADSVGMKGPALYHYFKGKDAILETLIENIDAYYTANFGNAGHFEHMPESMEELVQMSLGRLQFTMHDDRVKKVRRLLMMEQFRNEKLRDLATRHNLTAVEEMHRIFFTHLMETGRVVMGDASLLAFEFTAPVTILVQLLDRHPEREEEIMERVRQHMQHFINTYGV